MKQHEELSVSPPGGEQASLPTCKRTSLCECICQGGHAQCQPVLVHVHGVRHGASASAYCVNIGSEV